MIKLKFLLILLFLYSESIAQQYAGFNFLLNGIVRQGYDMKLKGLGIGSDFDASVTKKFEINFGTAISYLHGIRSNPIDTSFRESVPNGTTNRFYFIKRELTEITVPFSLRFKVIEGNKSSLKVSLGTYIIYRLKNYAHGYYYKPPTYPDTILNLGPFPYNRNVNDDFINYFPQEYMPFLSFEYARNTFKKNQIIIRSTFTFGPGRINEFGAMLSAGFRLNK